MSTDYTPSDYLAPQWDKYDRVHNWRNYVSDEVQAAWDSFTAAQKAMIARLCEKQAHSEDWD
jgi:hypothetical protein